MRYFYVIAVILMMLTGCASNVSLTREQTALIKQDIDPAELEIILAKATVISKFNLNADNRNYFVRYYKLQTGQRPTWTSFCTPTCFPVQIMVPIRVGYIVIQRVPTNELHAWGTLEKLSKNSDRDISSLMPMIKSKLSEIIMLEI